MTEPLFFDTDCISAFLWVENQSILAALYPGRIIIPRSVYDELSVPTIPQIKARVDSMIENGDAILKDIEIDSKEYELYDKLVNHPDEGHSIIGSGEAAAISLAKINNGILASNNLRDISQYIEEYSLQNKTTGDILVEAFDKGIITEDQGNDIWRNMIKKRRRIGAPSFSDYLRNHRN